MDWNLDEAAEALKTSVASLKEQMETQGIQPRLEDSFEEPRFLLSEEQFEALREASREFIPPTRPKIDLRTVPLEVHQQVQDALREALSVSREQREDRLEAEARARASENRLLALTSETAENMATSQLQLRTSEAQIAQALMEAAQAKSRYDELVAHNAREKARFEQEHQQILERLKTSEEKAQRFEKLPSWVTKLFGT